MTLSEEFIQSLDITDNRLINLLKDIQLKFEVIYGDTDSVFVHIYTQ